MSGYNPESFGPYDNIHINPTKLGDVLHKHLFITSNSLKTLTELAQELNLHYRAAAKEHIDRITKRNEAQLLGANKAVNMLGLRLTCVENELDAANKEISRLKELLNG